MKPMRILPLLAAALTTAAATHGVDLTVLHRQAEDGSPEAMYALGWLYDTGNDSITPDTALSTRFYRQAADLGFAPAQNYLGFRYYTGQGVERDSAAGMSLITKAAEGGYAPAMANLAWLLLEQKGDTAGAVLWLERADSAGNPAASAHLADVLLSGYGSQHPDTTRAISLLTRATDRRVPNAALTLTHLLTQTPAAERNDSLTAVAFASLGRAYSFGAGVPYNHDLSLALYLRAARMGHPDARRFIAETLEILPDALSAPNDYISPPVTDEEMTPLYWIDVK